MTARILLLFLSLSAAFAPLPVRADAAAARFHDARARRLYRADRYEEAIAEFFLAHRHAPNAGTLYNIATCFSLLRRWDEAFLHYTEYLEGAASDDPRRERAREALAEIEPRVARVRVVTDPPGATIYVDNLERGSYGISPRLLALPAGERRIELRLEGHRVRSATVTAVTGQEASLSVDLVAITGTMVVDANVASEVVVRTPDGAVVADGATPFRAALAPGPYELEVSAEGHVARRELVAVEEDTELTRSVRLATAPVPTGALTVTSSIQGSLVRIDDRPVGFTPLALVDVPTGARLIEVAAEGRESWSGPVSIARGDRAWLTVSLEDRNVGAHSEATWIVGATGIALTTAGLVFAGLAADAFARFNAGLEASLDVRQTRIEGEAFAVTADLSLIVGGAALLASLITFIVEEAIGSRGSSASITRRGL